jgi:hypothetical protein
MPERTQDRQVKGTFLIALAMIINHRKDWDWTKHTPLTSQDLNLIRDRILPSTWYEMGLFERMGEATFKMVGKNRPEAAYEFGENIMWQNLVKVYGNSLIKNDPAQALARFANLYQGIFFNTGAAEFKRESSGGIFRITDPLGIPSPESFIPMLKSLLKKIAAENQAQNILVTCPEENSLSASSKLNSASYRIACTAPGVSTGGQV